MHRWITAACELPRRIGKLLSLLVEERQFGLQHREFHTPLPTDPKKIVLFVNFTEWLPRATLDGVLARGMQMRGYTPVVLTRREFRWSQRRMQQFGIQHFVYFDEYLERAGTQPVPSEWPSRLTFDNLYGCQWKGIGIGRHVLSSVARLLTVGSIAFDDPHVRTTIDQCLARSLQTAAAAHAVMDDLKPTTVLFLEKGYTPYGELFDAALLRGISTIQYCHAHRDDLLLLKRYTASNRFQHPSSLSTSSWAAIRAHPWPATQEQAFMDDIRRSYAEGRWFNRKFLLKGKKEKSPDEVRAQLGLDPAKKTAVIFSHVLWDATFFFGDNLFPDYETWLVESVKVACKNTAVNWIIKLHPDYAWKMRHLPPGTSPRDVLALDERIGPLPPHIHVVLPDTDISTHSFFAVTDYCITVRGTIGIEAPCFGIPVFTAGTGRYSGLGFTNDSRTSEEYLDKLSHIQDFPRLTPEQTTLGRKHAWGLFQCRPLPFATCEIVSITRPNGALDHDVALRAKTTEELSRASDLQSLLDWMLDSHDEDYLRIPS